MTQECILFRFLISWQYTPNSSPVGKVEMKYNSQDPNLVLSEASTRRIGYFCSAVGGTVFIPQTWAELARIKAIFAEGYAGK